MHTITPPDTVTILQSRAKQIAQRSIGELANKFSIQLPKNMSSSKGLVGQIIEIVLGADANNKPIPDFTKLGIELKTIPLDSSKKVIETTYVCTAPIPPKDKIFEESVVFKKLSHVLWVPYMTDKQSELKDYRILNPVLWHPSCDEIDNLKQDWEELSEMLSLGLFGQISSHFGKALQLRPKAANSKQLINVLDEFDNIVKIVPKGFYLRKKFTQNLLENKR